MLGLILPISIADPLTHIISIPANLFLLVACTIIFFQGVNVVKFYLLGLEALVLSIMSFNLFAFGIVQYPILRHSIEIGTLVELSIFNFAIWVKINIINLDHSSIIFNSMEDRKIPNRIPELDNDLLILSSNEELSTNEIQNESLSNQPQRNKSRIDSLNIPIILSQLDELIEENIYCDEDLNLSRLASLLKYDPISFQKS
jgi:hypothetical protein